MNIVPIAQMHARMPRLSACRKSIGANIVPMDAILHLNRMLANDIEFSPVGCWLYRGQQTRNGYGRIWIGNRREPVHRWVYELLRGPLPEGLQCDHLCRVKHCCNPLHIEPVTLQENRRRAALAIVSCKHGHPFTPENTYIKPNGSRSCRTCQRQRGRVHDARRRSHQ